MIVFRFFCRIHDLFFILMLQLIVPLYYQIIFREVAVIEAINYSCFVVKSHYKLAPEARIVKMTKMSEYPVDNFSLANFPSNANL